MGEGWGEGEPPFVLSLSKDPVIASSVSDVAIPLPESPFVLSLSKDPVIASGVTLVFSTMAESSVQVDPLAPAFAGIRVSLADWWV